MRIKCLAQGHYCCYQQIRTWDLTIESPWSYPLSHNSSVDRQMLPRVIEMEIGAALRTIQHTKDFSMNVHYLDCK